MRKTFLIFLGPPGSGKGTQAELLAKKINLPIISPGDLLRHELELDTDLGKEAGPIMAKGILVPNKITNKLVAINLIKSQARQGAIFDGYPRNMNQLKFLIKKLDKVANEDNNVYGVYIEVSDKEVKERLGGRRACDCGAVYHLKYNPPKIDEICDTCKKKIYIRKDDKPEVIGSRLKVYYKETKPVLNFWSKKEKLIKINGEQSIEKVQQDIIKKLKQRRVID